MLLLLCVTVESRDRVYYIGVVEIEWDYAPHGKALVEDPMDKSYKIFCETRDDRIGGTYKKAVYKQYTDDRFEDVIEQPPWMGLFGPLLKGEAGDRIIIYFKNMASRPYSVHPHGVHYEKQHEGAIYLDKTKGEPKYDDEVAPGDDHKYIWVIEDEFVPTEDDEPCVPWAYHSHGTNVAADTNAGLIGPLVTCKKGVLDKHGNRKDADKEFPILMKIFNENFSAYLAENMKRCYSESTCAYLNKIQDIPFDHSNRMHSINGYILGNLPPFQACVADRVVFYIIGFGGERDIHSFRVEGQTFESKNRRVTVEEVISATFISAKMTLTKPGKRLVYCEVNDHFEDGMRHFLNVDQCGEDTLSDDTYLDGRTRHYKLMIEESIWDYAPTGYNRYNGRSLVEPWSLEARYFAGRGDRIGSQYKKALFREPTDDSFSEAKKREGTEKSLGMLGPFIKMEVGELLEVEVMNKATRPYSFDPAGLRMVGVDFESRGDGDFVTVPIEPGEKHTYQFYVPDHMGPTYEDPDCITYSYQSMVDKVRDVNSGLVGPLIVCKEGTLDKNNKQHDVDHEIALYFTNVDENLSWYLWENIDMFCVPDRVWYLDPGFVASNRKMTVNGRAYSNLKGIEFCLGNKVSFHIFAKGSEFDIHSIYFHGVDFEFYKTTRDTLRLFPGTTATLQTVVTKPGTWAIACRNNFHFTRGMTAYYNVKDCGGFYQTLKKPFMPRHTRRYFIGAVEVLWEYAPEKFSPITGEPLKKINSAIFVKDNDKFIGTKYYKALYKEYTDSSFEYQVEREGNDEHLGSLGPMIRAEKGDVIEIVFKNMASRPYSIHAHLVSTDKNNEGSLYFDKTHYKDDDRVPPGGYHVYRFDLSVHKGPSEGDPDCISSLYYSSVNSERDVYSGLIGPLVICRPGIMGDEPKRQDVAREFFLLFSVFNESMSWYFPQNVREFAPARMDHGRIRTDRMFLRHNLKHGINGYIYQGIKGLEMDQGDRIAWYFAGFGATMDIHSVHFHGNGLIEENDGSHITDVLNVFQETSAGGMMVADNPGQWLLHCHVNEHIAAGMETTYIVHSSSASLAAMTEDYDSGSDSSDHDTSEYDSDGDNSEENGDSHSDEDDGNRHVHGGHGGEDGEEKVCVPNRKK
ncbi:hypothetical protein LOTGIDRAFT_140833 [Lottia gigantea]|uniref:Plastocyanin-like domain-containing protein n=1 Tax=Lottia gigantea TaxID=225164 RepID=V4AZ60_LOTGI|nr:hypothetical protein LOTGIDRAFT_140833 [Lottia gigantea]ESP00401.1 hypothetical protein LOTGIDRAFT_140833 [Lottia gigantea]